MVKNATSVRAFGLCFLVSGGAVFLQPIATMAQVQDNSTSEVALDGDALSGITSDERPIALEGEPSQLPPFAAETLPKTDTATAPKVTGAIRELPPNELETANSPLSQTVAEVGKVADPNRETGTADDLSIQEDAAQVTSVSQLSDARCPMPSLHNYLIGISMINSVPLPISEWQYNLPLCF